MLETARPVSSPKMDPELLLIRTLPPFSTSQMLIPSLVWPVIEPEVLSIWTSPVQTSLMSMPVWPPVILPKPELSMKMLSSILVRKMPSPFIPVMVEPTFRMVTVLSASLPLMPSS